MVKWETNITATAGTKQRKEKSMKVFYGTGSSGHVRDAVNGLSSPKLIIMTTSADCFESCVAELENLFPGIPSIGCIARGYNKTVLEKGVTITAFTEGATCAAGALENVSKTPSKYISRLQDDLKRINPGRNDTAVIDFCSGNDAGVMNTLSLLLNKYNLQLMGATGNDGKISANGRIYEDGMAYALIKNNNGKVKAYKENIYKPAGDITLLASRTDKSRYYIGELNGRPAKQVYMEIAHCTEKDIETQTFVNPLGKKIGDDICIVSLKGVEGNGLTCYRQVNDSDILTLLQMCDPMEVAAETLKAIKNDFRSVSAVYSVNCAFRYIVLSDRGELNNYLGAIATLGTSCGLIGNGEHYNGQFVNQTMTCVVFE